MNQNIIVELPQKLIQALRLSSPKANSHSLENERCGIIVGKRETYERIRITKLIEDKYPVIQSPFEILRETSHIYPELVNLVNENNYFDYLGEWHTHPNGPMRASFMDHISMKEMVNNPSFGELSWIILLIFFPGQKFVTYYYENDFCKQIDCKGI